MHLSSCFTYKAQIMYEMVLLTTGFGEFEFPPTFSLLLLLDNKNAGKFKLKFAKCQKVRENLNSSNPVASITISYVTFALALGESTSADLDRMGN